MHKKLYLAVAQHDPVSQTDAEARAALLDVDFVAGVPAGAFNSVPPSQLNSKQLVGPQAAQHLAAFFGRRVVNFQNTARPDQI